MKQPLPSAVTPRQRIALIGTYLPRKCGIATFSLDIASALRAKNPQLAVDIFAMDDGEGQVYPSDVVQKIAEDCICEYRLAAERINAGGYSAVLLQHEFGIFGGEQGEYLLTLLRKLEVPVITTFHTVLKDPSEVQKRVTEEIINLSSRVIVMSNLAIEFLCEIYGTTRSKIQLVPHGIPVISDGCPLRGREMLGTGSPLIFTFGFLSPDKGIQHAIRAMPTILRERPEARYTVVGQTHPHILRAHGDVYRDSLVELTSSLGLEKHVTFINRFVGSDELLDCLAGMDYYVTPYLNPKQITSGTLAYSVGAGKAVVSTPYWYAQEVLEDDRGVLVPFGDAESIANAILGLEADESRKREIEEAAREYGLPMQWPEVATSYLRILAETSLHPARIPTLIRLVHPNLPAFNLNHLETLTDDTGILQHARFDIPCRAEGYCVDDNARALLFTLQLEQLGELSPALALAQSRYLSFVFDAFNEETMRFRNFMSYSRQWLEPAGSEDSHGRSIWALGSCVLMCKSRARRSVADSVFWSAAQTLLETSSPRTWAYGILGLVDYYRATGQTWAREMIKTLAHRLLSQHAEYSLAGWHWFENSLTYANARIPQALLLASDVLADSELRKVGLESLEWLMETQSDEHGQFIPIGSESFYTIFGDRALFDQQPVEACCSISACLTAGAVSNDPKWRARATRVFGWFTGDNTLGQSLLDSETGGCRDGIHPQRLNENQGAESTLSYLCSLAELKLSVSRDKVLRRVV